MAQAHRAELKGQVFQGVKGKTALSELPLIDLSTAFVPECMHSMLIGVGKQFLQLWMERPGPWNIKKKNAKQLNNFLLQIQPPSFFNRMPRSILLAHFYKASEYLNWILFYSLPTATVKEFLPNKHFQHWFILLVEN